MSKFAQAVLFILVAFAYVSAYEPVFALKNADYIQRGILTTNGNDFTFTAYIRNVGGETRLVLDSPVGVFASAELDSEGKELMCEGGAFFPKRLARKFVLRDFRAALGFLTEIDADNVLLRFAADGRILKIEYPGYSMEFSDYENFEGFENPLPKTIEIKASGYSMRLTLANAKPSK